MAQEVPATTVKEPEHRASYPSSCACSEPEREPQGWSAPPPERERVENSPARERGESSREPAPEEERLQVAWSLEQARRGWW